MIRLTSSYYVWPLTISDPIEVFFFCLAFNEEDGWLVDGLCLRNAPLPPLSSAHAGLGPTMR